MKNKIKAVQVGFSYQHGGIETFALSYDPYLNDDNISTDYINVFPQAKKIKLFQELNGKRNIVELPDYRRKPISYIREFCKLQKKNKYQILHYNMNSAVYLVPLIAAKIAGVPVRIAHAHNSSSDKGFIKEAIHNVNKRLVPFFSNAYFACSGLAANWFFSTRIINGNYYYKINNAINTMKFSFDPELREKIRKQLNANNKTVIAGHIGRFEPQKNHRFLISLFGEYIIRNPNAKLLLIGDGTLFKEIKRIVLDNPVIKDKVVLLGQINNVNEYLNALDIFVLPSLYEGFPYVGIEAQVNGLPCLFSSAITSELKQSDNVIYERLSNNLSYWINDIEKLLNDNTRQTKKILEYDINYSAERLKTIYLSLIKNCGASAYD